MKKKYFSWEEIGKMMDELISKISREFDGVYGLPRGGLILAVKASHELKIPLLNKPTKNSLVVDDLSDNGKSLSKIPNKKIACLFTTDWKTTQPDFFIGKKERKGDWIVFPWESKD